MRYKKYTMPYHSQKYYTVDKLEANKAPHGEVLMGETLAVFPDLVHEEVVQLVVGEHTNEESERVEIE